MLPVISFPAMFGSACAGRLTALCRSHAPLEVVH